MFSVASTISNQVPTFTTTDTNLHVPFVFLSTQDNVKLLKQLESDFKRTINWNKYQSKKTSQTQNRYLHFLIDPSFQGVNRLFLLSFENENGRENYNRYYLPTVEMKDYNVMIDGRIYDNIRNIAPGQGDDYKTGFLLDYPQFKDQYKMIAIDSDKHQALDAHPKIIQQNNFTGNLNRQECRTMFFIIKEAKETILDFSQSAVKVLEFFLLEYNISIK